MNNIHATSLDINGAGVLIVGPSGAGKSDLALRLIENKGAVLVADDRTNLEAKGGLLWAKTPENIEGMMEVRGIGLVQKDFKPQTIVKLVVAAQKNEKIERMPEKTFFKEQGVEVECILLNLLEASAPDKVVVKLNAVLEEERQNA